MKRKIRAWKDGRTEPIYIKVTPTEKDEIDRKAAEMNLNRTDFIIAATKKMLANDARNS